MDFETGFKKMKNDQVLNMGSKMWLIVIYYAVKKDESFDSSDLYLTKKKKRVSFILEGLD